MSDQFPCPCCGFRTLNQRPPGTHEICPVCWWEDDDVQSRDPDFAGGANNVSLRTAMKNFREFGASDLQFTGRVRAPRLEDSPNSCGPAA